MLRPAEPPSLRRTRLWIVAVAVGPGTMITAAALGASHAPIVWVASVIGVMLATLCVAVVSLAVKADRLRRRFRDEPFDRCPRCEHPLPTPPRAPGEAEATCTECGLTQSLAEHRRPWEYYGGKRPRRSTERSGGGPGGSSCGPDGSGGTLTG